MHQKLTETFAKYERIILVGGGTGGHIQPILSVVKELKDQELLWIGGKDSQEEKQAIENSIPFVSLPILKLSTTKSPKIFLYPFVLIRGILKARKILKEQISRLHSQSSFRSKGQIQNSKLLSNQPTNLPLCVFSKGGPGSVAISIAAWTLRIPLYIHESDTIPGRSNQLLGKIATKVFLGFDSAKKYFNESKCEVVGQILDPVFSNQSSKQSTIAWKTDKKHILVICGSQGARSIFEAILKQFSDKNLYEWIIALGKLNSGMKSDFEPIENMQALEWINQADIAQLLHGTDIAITRGSATTLAEIDIQGVRKIIIPLPSAAKNHQYWNACEYEQKGDILLEQKDLNTLSETIKNHV